MTSWFMSHRHLHSKDHHILLAFWRALDEKLTNRDNLQTWNSNSTTVRRPSLWIWSWGILWMKCRCPLQLPKRRINLTRQNVMEGVTKLQNRMERELGTMLTFRLALSMTQAGIARVESGSHLKKLGNAWTKSMRVPCGRWWCNLQKTQLHDVDLIFVTRDSHCHKRCQYLNSPKKLMSLMNLRLHQLQIIKLATPWYFLAVLTRFDKP